MKELKGEVLGNCPRCGGEIIQIEGFAPGCINNCGDLREAKSSNLVSLSPELADKAHGLICEIVGAWNVGSIVTHEVRGAVRQWLCDVADEEQKRLRVETPAPPPLIEEAFDLMNDAPLVAHAEHPKSVADCHACMWLGKVQDWYSRSGLPEKTGAES